MAEQLLYEVGDPSAYFTPDAVADFSTVSLDEVGTDLVRAHGATGRERPPSYKVSAAIRDGFTASGMLVVVGPDAAERARHCGDLILRRAGGDFAATHVECLGAGECQPAMPRVGLAQTEVVLRVAVRDAARGKVERFAKEFAPLVTSGPPGVTGYATARPVVREVFAFWPALIDRTAITATVEIL